MGEDKSLLLYQGCSLLRRTYDLARPSVDAVYVVTSWRDRYASLLPTDCHWIDEPSPQGPLIAFALVLPAIATDWILLLACDLPRLDRQTLAHGIAQLPSVDKGAIAFLPRHAKGWEPMGGFYRRHSLDSLIPYVASGGRSFQCWLSHQRIQEWHLPNPQALFNCNTPDDWQSLSP
jgi:molybdopterin-guanine dinucleotide biosynthesis protein A